MGQSSTLVLLRHGESVWNLENIFTGWTDVPLSPKGEAEARSAGQLLEEAGIEPDVVHTSLLRRAINTANLTLDAMDRGWIPVRRHWRLNERHYGDLQGRNKSQTAEEFGAEQVHVWRRSYSTAPPPVAVDDDRHPANDPRYAHLAPEQLPATECLADVVERMLPYWYDAIVPDLRAGSSVLVAAHGNSLRALVKHLDGVSDEEIPGLNIPTGIPLRYVFDSNLKVLGRGYLGDPLAAEEAAARVAAQASG